MELLKKLFIDLLDILLDILQPTPDLIEQLEAIRAVLEAMR